MALYRIIRTLLPARSAAATSVRPEDERKSWELWPSARSMGYWLVQWRDDLTIRAYAPPAVALHEDFGSPELRYWRVACWGSIVDFTNGRLPNSTSERVCLDDVVDEVPSHLIAWMARVTEHHAHALLRTIELAEATGRTDLLHNVAILKALAKTQHEDAARLARAADARPDERHVAAAALIRRLWDLPLVTRSPAELGTQFDAATRWPGLDGHVRVLLALYWDARRDLEVVKRSKSWRWTSRFRQIVGWIRCRALRREPEPITKLHRHQEPDWLSVHQDLDRARAFRDCADKVVLAAAGADENGATGDVPTADAPAAGIDLLPDFDRAGQR